MKKISILAATVIVALSVSVSSCNSRKNVKLKSSLDSASYALGVSQGEGFKQGLKTLPGDPINVDLMLAGLEIALKGDSSAQKMTAQQAGEFLNKYFTEVHTQDLQKNKEEGEKFLAENASKDGVITTESGLQYKVITQGTGERPKATDKVKVHYKGTFLDGTEFDSSYKRNEPVEFEVEGGVIKGWTEALQIMPVGSKYIIWVPANLGYGENDYHGIKGHSTLQFEIELLEIVKDEDKNNSKK